MEAWVKEAAYMVALVSEAIAVFFIASGIFGVLWIYGKSAFLLGKTSSGYLLIRRHLGSSLSLSLEFLIGADILKTAIAPTWQEIGMLASIVAIRTILTYFLMLEMRGLSGIADAEQEEIISR